MTGWERPAGPIDEADAPPGTPFSSPAHRRPVAGGSACTGVLRPRVGPVSPPLGLPPSGASRRPRGRAGLPGEQVPAVAGGVQGGGVGVGVTSGLRAWPEPWPLLIGLGACVEGGIGCGSCGSVTGAGSKWGRRHVSALQVWIRRRGGCASGPGPQPGQCRSGLGVFPPNP